ncbi:MAG: FAD-dependent oxidoreductase [Opitutaceae bacterium]|jgi:hypothetical protein|nr:FAD-dependent oxidoreductase [Opitutaceae bacterium]
MPDTQPAPDTFVFQRRIPVEDGHDLVVAGGGPGGVAAAIRAGRLGAKVLLLEQLGCLGGAGTSALVSAWSDMGDGSRPIVGGLFLEIVEELYRRGAYKPNISTDAWRKNLHGGMAYNPEKLKLLLDELCADAGVEVRFFTKVIDADVAADGRVNGVVTHNIEGHRLVRGKAFVDATGDAALSVLCGVKVREAGRDTRHIMAPTLCATQVGLDGDVFKTSAQQAAVHKAIADGFFTQNDRHVPGLFRWGQDKAILNAGHLFGTDALNCRSLSDGMVKGRKFAAEYTEFFRRYVPGCERMEYVATGALLGIRESRRIVGEYELNYADFTARRWFPDQIAAYNKSVDMHVHDCSDEQWERYTTQFLKRDRTKAGEYYGIPYGILVPKGSANLWVAGRCNCSDLRLHAAIRDQPACYMMGEAAGTAAVQSVRTGQPAADLDTEALVGTLRANGAYLPQPALSKTMTRGEISVETE